MFRTMNYKNHARSQRQLLRVLTPTSINCYAIYATNDAVTPAHQYLTDHHAEDLQRILHGMHSGTWVASVPRQKCIKKFKTPSVFVLNIRWRYHSFIFWIYPLKLHILKERVA